MPPPTTPERMPEIDGNASDAVPSYPLVNMTTRSIVTSQPDVACGICGRRLLRGEQPEFFIAGAERRTVCELCVPRAANEGWRREADGASPTTRRALRGRRGRTLLDRLRQLREPSRVTSRRSERQDGVEPYEFIPGPELSNPARVTGFFGDAFYEDHHDERSSDSGPEEQDLSSHTGAVDPHLQRAIDLFNNSGQPRRIAGIARSLGDPAVTVRVFDPVDGQASIVVAWELCWYRYNVDLAATQSAVALGEQGMELSELPDEDRHANAAADERGELTPLVG